MIPRTALAFRIGSVTLSLCYLRHPVPGTAAKAIERAKAAQDRAWEAGYQAAQRDREESLGLFRDHRLTADKSLRAS